jgi:hypothetical protein
MSDFLLSVDNQPQSGSRQLLRLLQRPYPYRRPDGEEFEFPWGRMAVLRERFAKNVFRVNGTVVAWVGDLLTETSEAFLKSLILRALELKQSDGDQQSPRKPDPALDPLNGTYAFAIADSHGFSLITDPMNFQQVYRATDHAGKTVAVGTHPDLVARVGQAADALDLTSLGEFLHGGTPLFPHTVYENVHELYPGSIYKITVSPVGQQFTCQTYWTPPAEVRDGQDERSLAEELREILLAIVRSRCRGNKVGVFLSGGLDSRVILAAVPKSLDCVGVTFSNCTNRETGIAKRVAACYNRDWVLLLRAPDFLANCFLDSVKLTGCEYDWTCGQVIGFAPDLEKLGLDVILEGTLFNDYFKAYCAKEWVLDKQWGGLLPGGYRKTDWDYVQQFSKFWQANLGGDVFEQMWQRRRQTYEHFADPRRGSLSEWMEVYPFSQDATIGYWPAERRTMPVRLVAMDRRALDFSFRCPIELRLGGRLFKKAACQIFGKGVRIPDANDGVRPDSGPASRLVQRALYEVRRGGRRLAERLGRPPRVQTSWHHYPLYWQQSTKMRQLRQQFGPNLDEFDGALFAGRGRDLLEREDVYWEYRFRLLQLAAWREIIRGYAA